MINWLHVAPRTLLTQEVQEQPLPEGFQQQRKRLPDITDHK